MTPEYLPTDLETKRVHIIEEMAEVLQMYAKIQRFGELSVNPQVPEEEQITNIEAFHNELNDLDGAIGRYFVHYYQDANVLTDRGIINDMLDRTITLD